jgi:hypothetical protein
MASWKDLGLKPDTEGDKSRACRGIISQVKKTGGGMTIMKSSLLLFYWVRFCVEAAEGKNVNP